MTDSRFDAKTLYDVYSTTIRFRNRVCGGTPKNPDLLKGWIAATTEHNDATTDQQVNEARAALLEPTEEKSWNGFRGDELHGLYLEARQVKALFRECATMLRVTLEKRGSKQIFQHGFEIKGALNPTHPERLYLGTKEPTASAEGPIHVDTAQGPRSAIKRVDYVENAMVTFEIWVLATDSGESRHIGEKELTRMLKFGQENGLGSDRSQGHGKFDVTAFSVVQRADRKDSSEEDAPAKAPKKLKTKAAA